MSAFDKLENKKRWVLKKEFYENPDRYVGIKTFTKEKKLKCEICGTNISASNLKRHKEAHLKNYVWITDNKNYNSIKVTEYFYYTKLKEDYYVIDKNKNQTFGYINGSKFNIKWVGKVNKELSIKIMETLKKENKNEKLQII